MNRLQTNEYIVWLESRKKEPKRESETTSAALRGFSLHMFISLHFVANEHKTTENTITRTPNEHRSQVECTIYEHNETATQLQPVLQYQMLEMHAETIQVRDEKRKESIKSMLNKFVDSCILVQCQISNGQQENRLRQPSYTKSKLKNKKKKTERTN